MILDGVEVVSTEHLEGLIALMPESTKVFLRNEYMGTPSATPSAIKPVTPRQIRLALVSSGVNLDSITAAINAMPEPQKTFAYQTWEYSNEFQRDNPLVTALGPALGFTAAQLDGLWQLAGTL